MKGSSVAGGDRRGRRRRCGAGGAPARGARRSGGELSDSTECGGRVAWADGPDGAGQRAHSAGAGAAGPRVIHRSGLAALTRADPQDATRLSTAAVTSGSRETDHPPVHGGPRLSVVIHRTAHHPQSRRRDTADPWFHVKHRQPIRGLRGAHRRRPRGEPADVRRPTHPAGAGRRAHRAGPARRPQPAPAARARRHPGDGGRQPEGRGRQDHARP